MMDMHILSDPVSNFWKCPKKGVYIFFVVIFNHIFYMFGLIGYIKTFSKVLGVGMNDVH